MPKFLKIFGLTCFILAAFLFWQRYNPKRISFNSSPTEKLSNKHPAKDLPARLIIKKTGIDLPILPAKISGQIWDTTSLGASWLTISPVPGEQGNSILYGHNWTNLLGNLLLVKPGDEILIRYQNGKEKKFTAIYTAKVFPDDISILKPTADTRITIYTCTGLFDEKRFVVVSKAGNI